MTKPHKKKQPALSGAAVYPQRWHFLVLLLAIVLPVGVIYWPALWGGWIGDDNLLVAQNTVLEWKPGHTWEGLAEILRGDKAADYYPVTTFVYWIEQRLFGWKTFGFHLVNVILHAVDAVLVWLLLRRLAIPGAWLAGLIFAVHPVHVESVAWISELKNVLSMLFMLLGFNAFLDFEAKAGRRRFLNFLGMTAAFLGVLLAIGAVAEAIAGGGRVRNYLVALTAVPVLLALNYLAQIGWRKVGPRYHYLSAIVFFLLGVVSKAHIVVFPLFILLYVWWRDDFGWFKKRESVGRAEEPFFRTLHWFLGSAATLICLATVWYLFFLPHHESEHALVAHLPLLAAVGFICGLGAFAVAKGSSWLHRAIVWTVPFLILALLIGAVEVCFQHGRGLGGDWIQIGDPLRRLANGGRAIWWYLEKAYLPLHLIPIYPGWRFDAATARDFVPLLGVVVLTIVLFVNRRGWARPLFLAYAFFVIGLLPVLGFFKMAVAWQNTLVTDHFQYISNIAAIALFAAGVAWVWDRTRLVGRSVIAIVTGLLLTAMGVYSWDRANTYRNEDTMWADVLEKNPDSWQGQFRVASGLMAEQKFAEAAGLLERAVPLRPDNPDLRNTLGLAYARLGRFDDAIAQYQTALDLQKGRTSPAAVRASITTRVNMANAVASIATSALSSAASLRREGVFGAAESQEKVAQENLRRAAALYREALLYEPNHAAAHRNLALVLTELGDREGAVEHLRIVLRLVPNEPVARELLSEIEGRREAR